jgi:Tfp pilus assembly protein PilF
MKYLHLIILLCLTLTLANCGGENPPQEASVIPEGITDARGLTDAAIKKQQIGAFAEALEILDKAVEVDSMFVEAYVQMGAVYDEWDKKTEAVAAFKKALQVDPASIDGRLGLAAVYSKLTRNDLAVKEYLQAAEARPNDLEIHFKIALEYWYFQKLPESAAAYQRVIELDSNHIQAHLNLISVYEKMEQWEEAVAEIETSIQLGKQNNDEQAIAIAERKRKFILGRMNMTPEEYKRKTQPPFE